MKFGEVFDYRNAKEAKKYIGKKGMFSDSLRDISDLPEYCEVLILREIEEGVTFPFAGEKGVTSPFGGEDKEEVFKFFRPILEEEELMTNRQLVEWLARGNGEYAVENSLYAHTQYSYPVSEADKPPVRDDILIRRWKDTEWSKPTKAIYEEDCK